MKNLEPIVVDLDGTLINTDTLYEQFAVLLFSHIEKFPKAAAALLGGRAAFKAFHAENVALAVDTLNYNPRLIQMLETEKQAGRRIVLCTAADQRTAEAVARHHEGLFDEVIATRDGINLKGAAKGAVLTERFPDGFVYAGDNVADLAVWKLASAMILVGVSEGLKRRATALGKPILAEFNHGDVSALARIRIWLKAFRAHHWAKNLILFVPMVLGHFWTDISIVANSLIGFALLIAVTSSTYLINDVSDLEADRRHPTKRNRPLASGAISIRAGLLTSFTAIPVALVLAYILNPGFAVTLFGYLVVTLLYSFVLKRIPLLDTFIIGCLFTSRVLMGGALTGMAVSPWLIAFSAFFFFSLATAKRHVEVLQLDKGVASKTSGRGYVANDAPLTLGSGLASATAAIIILLLYLINEAFITVGYSRPDALWAIIVVVSIWLGRIWVLTHRAQMLDDPVSFALRDKPSLVLGAIAAFSFVVAL